MSNQNPVILIVDDEPFNLEIISEYLDGLDYELVMASSGEQSWSMLQAEPHRFQAVLLDRMMPGINGIEVLRNIKRDPVLKVLPVIIQSAASSPEEIAEGLHEGAFYYLPKPFNPDVLRAIVSTALRDYNEFAIEKQDINDKFMALNQLEDAFFTFRTTEEVRRIVLLLSCLCPSREAAHMGLTELMLNAVEHGNLGITYEEKSELIAADRLHEEVALRLTLPEFSDKVASIRFRRDGHRIIFNIIDQGQGFDWEPYLEMSMDRLADSHGRGIAMARGVAFAGLTYLGSGNQVEAVIDIGQG